MTFFLNSWWKGICLLLFYTFYLLDILMQVVRWNWSCHSFFLWCQTRGGLSPVLFTIYLHGRPTYWPQASWCGLFLEIPICWCYLLCWRLGTFGPFPNCSLDDASRMWKFLQGLKCNPSETNLYIVVIHAVSSIHSTPFVFCSSVLSFSDCDPFCIVTL